MLSVEILTDSYYIESFNCSEIDNLLETLFFLNLNIVTVSKIIKYIIDNGSGNYDLKVFYCLERIQMRKEVFVDDGN